MVIMQNFLDLDILLHLLRIITKIFFIQESDQTIPHWPAVPAIKPLLLYDSATNKAPLFTTTS